MNLLIISNMAHYRKDGRVYGWGPTVEEIDSLATVFDEIRHLACLHQTPVPGSAMPYVSKNVHLIDVPPAGGNRWRDKANILRLTPLYASKILRALAWADAVHVRCPANTSLIAIMLLALFDRPRVRWVKYAGNWVPGRHEPWSFRLQRWWLKAGLHRGVVTVNGNWPDQPKHVFSFMNPCLSLEQTVGMNALSPEKALTGPVRLLYVGHLSSSKGAGRALQIVSRLENCGEPVTLDVLGDGRERAEFESLARALSVDHLVKFHGWVRHDGLQPFYERGHIILLPSDHEGWPKVLGEAMAYGVVPIASAVGSIPQVLTELGCGMAVPAYDIDGFVNAIRAYELHPDRWKNESRIGMRAAHLFTYESYVRAVKAMFMTAWGVAP